MEQGPYKHYQRPQKSRISREYEKSSKWGTIIVILVLILMVLVPLSLHAATKGSDNQEEAGQIQKKQSKKTRPAAKTHTRKVRKSKSDKAKKPVKKAKPAKKPHLNKNAGSKKIPKTYVVKSGDTISSIAKRYGLTQAQLQQVNGLGQSSSINAGETIKLR